MNPRMPPVAIRRRASVHRFGAAHRIDAGEGHDDIAVLGGEGDHFVVGNLRPSGEPLVDGKDHAADVARPVVFGQFLAAITDAGISEVLARGLFGGVAGRLRLNVDVRVDGDQIVEFHVS